MSSISTLLTRNLHDVFGENDAARRRAAVDEIFTEDCVFYDPSREAHRGRDAIDFVAATVCSAGRIVEHSIFGVDLINGGPPTRGVILTEDV